MCLGIGMKPTSILLVGILIIVVSIPLLLRDGFYELGFVGKNKIISIQLANTNGILEDSQKSALEAAKGGLCSILRRDPPSSWCILIDRPGYYELDSDIINCTYECGIYISASNVVLDGKGHIMTGAASESSRYGIYVDEATNVTIRNIRIRRWSFAGIYLYFSSSNRIYDTSVESSYHGIYLYFSNSNAMWNNTIKNSDWTGIFLQNSSSNDIHDNIMGDNDCGIYLYGSTSSNNRIHNNIIQNSITGGISLYGVSNNKIYNNTIISSDQFGMVLDSSDNNKIYGNTIQNSTHGIHIFYSDSNSIYNNIIRYNAWGLYFDTSYNNKIVFNSFMNNTFHVSLFQNNLWTTSNNITYIYDGKTWSSRLGNYWDNYTGNDTDGDGVGDSAHEEDLKPLIEPMWNYRILDTDNDGLDDIEEEAYNTNPTNNDTDKDGMPDGWEVQYGLDPLDFHDAYRDPDIDGLTNYEEYIHATNPYDSDTDDDGMPDGWEVRYNLNPLDASDAGQDIDDDGLTNAEEYVYNADPTDNDTDNDSLSDGEEAKIYHTDPADEDTDDDGLPDEWEVRYDLNPLNPGDAYYDPDADDLPNYEEYTHATNPRDPDTDKDGMPDGWEVQYDLSPLDASDAHQDKDGDGLANVAEYIYNTDPTDNDTDNDNLFDGDEVNIYDTDPTDNDTDDDGMPDGWEVQYDLNPLDPSDAYRDSDGDGLTNRDECRRGTNPRSIDSDMDLLPDTIDFILGPLDTLSILAIVVLSLHLFWFVRVRHLFATMDMPLSIKEASRRVKAPRYLIRRLAPILSTDGQLVYSWRALNNKIFEITRERPTTLDELIRNLRVSTSIVKNATENFVKVGKYLLSPSFIEYVKEKFGRLSERTYILLADAEKIFGFSRDVVAYLLENVFNFAELAGGVYARSDVYKQLIDLLEEFAPSSVRF